VGVLDDGRILNIAGDYIAHGIRHRASELVTRELGHQSEIELQAKLQNEVEAERPTRLDKMLVSEQQEQGVIDLRPGEGATWLVRENRNFHTIQCVEAAKRQHELLAATDNAPLPLLAAARYLAAHATTTRSERQTFEIARRLHRGENLYENVTP